MLRDFKKFVMQGNIVDLAVAVVIGAAFGVVVKSLVTNILTPILGIPGKTDFSALAFEVNGSKFLYGAFLNDVIGFVSIAAAVFFFVVKPMGVVMAKITKEKAATVRDCDACLSEIPVAANKCKYCATAQPVAS